MHQPHDAHAHVHSEHCGHVRIQHDGHVDYVHDQHLHAVHADHYDEHTIEVSNTNPATCAPVACACGHTGCGHQQVPHGDHLDFVYEGRLHHLHGDHCDDHGPVTTV